MARRTRVKPIRTGLLHVPVLDEAAGKEVRQVLRILRGLIVLQEGYAAGQRHWIEETLIRWCDEEELDLILTIGGTLPAPGPSSDEIVPEATSAVIERPMMGLAHFMRTVAWDACPLAMIDRGVIGIRGRTLIINLPAGADPAAEFLEGIVDQVPFVLALLRQDEDAMTHAQAMEAEAATDGVDDDWWDEPGEEDEDAAPPAQKAAGKGLNAGDFADFLRRQQEKPRGDE